MNSWHKGDLGWLGATFHLHSIEARLAMLWLTNSGMDQSKIIGRPKSCEGHTGFRHWRDCIDCISVWHFLEQMHILRRPTNSIFLDLKYIWTRSNYLILRCCLLLNDMLEKFVFFQSLYPNGLLWIFHSSSSRRVMFVSAALSHLFFPNLSMRWVRKSCHSHVKIVALLFGTTAICLNSNMCFCVKMHLRWKYFSAMWTVVYLSLRRVLHVQNVHSWHRTWLNPSQTLFYGKTSLWNQWNLLFSVFLPNDYLPIFPPLLFTAAISRIGRQKVNNCWSRNFSPVIRIGNVSEVSNAKVTWP